MSEKQEENVMWLQEQWEHPLTFPLIDGSVRVTGIDGPHGGYVFLVGHDGKIELLAPWDRRHPNAKRDAAQE